MNDREKKLIFALLGIGFLLANFYGFSVLHGAKEKKQRTLDKNETKIEEMDKSLAEIDKRADELDWYYENQPAEGSYTTIQAQLLSAIERGMGSGLTKKANTRPLPEPTAPDGNYHTVSFQAYVTGRDPDIYRWLVSLQDPKKFRAITYLKMEPQYKDDTQLECLVTITQWFLEKSEDSEDAPENATTAK